MGQDEGVGQEPGGCLLVVVRTGEIQMNSIQNTAPGVTKFSRSYNKRTQVTMRGGKCYELEAQINYSSDSGSGKMAVEGGGEGGA